MNRGSFPEGRITVFLMGDLAGSTANWLRAPDAMDAALQFHDELVARSVAAADGNLFKHTGDGFIAQFNDADRCLDAARAIRTGLAEAPEVHGEYLQARLAIDCGWATPRDLDWFGPGVNRVARITDLASTVGLVMSSEALRLLRTPPQPNLLASLGEVRLKSHVDAVELFGLVGGGLAAGRPASERALPQARTPLVGRSAERAALVELLGTHRMVTLLALGGAGKTRLAVGVAHASDRAAFADLSSARDAIGCARVIAEAVGVDLDAVAPTTSATMILLQAAAQLASADELLVLDNCEHVLDAAAEQANRLLTECPNLRVLATSRLPLEVAGEFVWRLPDFGAGPELFMQRAAATGVPLGDHPDVRAAVEVICDQLHQLPLAIELAAARLLSLDLSDLLAELQTNTGASAIRDVVRWSYDQLPPKAQRLFERLALLESSFSNDDLSLFDGVDRGQVAEILRSSLISADRQGLDLRYRMLQPIRHVALGLLRERDEFDQAMEELVAGLDRVMPDDYGQSHYDWESLDRLRPLLPTLWAVVDWMAESRQDVRLLRFLGNISGAVVVFSDAKRLTDLMLEHIEQRSELPIDQQADLLASFVLTGIASMQTDIATMGVIGLFGIEAGPDAPVALAHRSAALGALYDAWLDDESQDDGRQLLEQAHVLARSSASDYESSAVVSYKAWADLLVADWAAAEAESRSGLAATTPRNAWHLVMTATRGMALIRLGRHAEAFDTARSHPERYRFSYWGDLLGYVEILALAADGEHVQAQRALRETLSAALESTHMCHRSDLALVAAWVRIYRGDLEGAAGLIANRLAPRGPVTLQLMNELPSELPAPIRVGAAETEEAERALTPYLESELAYLEQQLGE